MEIFSQKNLEPVKIEASIAPAPPKNEEAQLKKEKKQKKKFLRSREERYNHKLEFVDIEKNMVSLVEKLKDRIDENYYDTLVSDEVGGRIPALVIKRIIDERSKKDSTQAKQPKIFFLNFGRDNLDENALLEFLKKANLKGQKILIVTEAIEYGGSMKKAVNFLQKAGIEDVEIATIVSKFNHGGDYLSTVWDTNKETGRFESRIVDDRMIEDKRVFSGQTHVKRGPFLDKYGPGLTGVEKEIRGENIVGAHPKKLKAIKDMNIPDYRSNKSRSYAYRDLSDEELQKNINEAREDVDTMAKVILRKVWKD